MALVKFDPFREFRDFENRFLANMSKKEESSISDFTPRVNTREGEYAYHVDVDLPGVKKENINIDVKDNVLVISGERNFKDEVKEEDYYKVETSFGKFTRSFTLPDSVDVENISASCEEGVLEVVIPKMEDAKVTKKIEIK